MVVVQRKRSVAKCEMHYLCVACVFLYPKDGRTLRCAVQEIAGVSR